MKILRLKSKNINSLKGDNEIDFVAFLNGGSLFAITGETGSGKSTILDAITCALYGRTARLSRGAEVHELMSRGTAEAMCEVEFEVNQKRYRSSWAIRRARNAPDGKVQPVKMELVALPDERVIESKASRVPKKVEEITGLDFDRFTQSMMLAQGGFDAFLKAEEKERSKLLEKITGTRIYSEISKAVHERVRESREGIERIKAELGGIGYLSDDELQSLNEAYSAKKGEVAKSKELMDGAVKAYEIKQQHSALTKELEAHRKREAEIKKEIEEKKPLYEKLRLAEKALAISAIYAKKAELEKAVQEDSKALETLETDIEGLKKSIDELHDEKQRVEKEYQEEKNYYDTNRDKLKKAMEFRNSVKAAEDAIEEYKKGLKTKREEIAHLEKELNTLDEQKRSLEQQANRYEEYLKAHEADEKLVSDVESISSLIREYRNAVTSLAKTMEEIEKIASEKAEREKSLEKSEKHLRSLAEESESDEKHYREIDGKVKELEEKEGRLKEEQRLLEEIGKRIESYIEDAKRLEDEKRDYRNFSEKARMLSAQRDELKKAIENIKAHIQTLREKREQELLIRKYEEDRKKLKVGEPCFLCGSTEHPYVEHAEMPNFDADDRIAEQNAKLSNEEERLVDLEKEITSLETKAENARLEQEKIASRIEEHKSYFAANGITLSEESSAEIRERLEAVESQLLQLTALRNQRDDFLTQKERSRVAHSEEERKRDALKEHISRLDSELEHKRQIAEQHRNRASETKEKLGGYWEKYGLTFDDRNLESGYEGLLQRKRSFDTHNKELRDTQDKIAQIEADKGAITAKIESAQNTIEEVSVKLRERETQREEWAAKQKEILDVDDLEDYGKNLEKRWQEATDRVNKITTEHRVAAGKLKEKQERLRIDTEALRQKRKEHQEASETFYAVLREKGLESEEAFKAAQLPDAQIMELKGVCEALDTKLNETSTLRQGAEEKLAKLEENPIPDRDLEVLSAEKKICEERFAALNRELGEIENRLATDRANRQKHQSTIEKLRLYENEHSILEKLNDLIGSADGAKFSKFAQGITLGQLVNLANRHLGLLTDRYAIIRPKGEGQQLTLAIVDRYQGDEIRPSNTLSGGESFLVSLSLALGLSELASRKISIDSLFLDEGFGTLDAETLDTALDALSMLESRGKMIGVISHVETMKERIPLQIRVHKNGGGESRIELVG